MSSCRFVGSIGCTGRLDAQTTDTNYPSLATSVQKRKRESITHHWHQALTDIRPSVQVSVPNSPSQRVNEPPSYSTTATRTRRQTSSSSSIFSSPVFAFIRFDDTSKRSSMAVQRRADQRPRPYDAKQRPKYANPCMTSTLHESQRKTRRSSRSRSWRGDAKRGA